MAHIFRNLPHFFIAALITMAGTANAGEGSDWKKVKEDDGVTVYQRKVPNWSINQIRANGLISATPEALLSVITDSEKANQLNKIIVNSARLAGGDQDEYHYYIIMDMPWPTTDRFAVYQRTITQNSDSGTVTVTDQADANIEPPIKTDKLVRMVRSTQEWKLETQEDGQTEVSLTVLTDPNGPIPAFIINTMSVDAPLETLQNLRKLATAKN